MAEGPSRLVTWLVGRLLPRTLRESVVGDLAERYQRRLLREGVGAARRGYWQDAWNVVRSLGSYSDEPTSLTPPRAPTDGLGADFRFAVRLYTRRPGIAALVIVTLGLAIGGSTALFSVLKPALLEALPYPNGDRLVMLWEREQGGTSNLGYTTIADLAEQTTTLDRVAAIGEWSPTWLGRGEPSRLVGQRVSHGYFGALGVAPALGRDFVEDDDQPGAERVAIVSHRLWREQLGADARVVGQAVSLDGTPFTVIGVMGEKFENLLGPRAEIWSPLRYDRSLEQACRSCRHLRAVARLRPDQSVAAAASDVDRVGTRMTAEFPREYRGLGFAVEPMKATVTKASRTALWILFGAVALVLGLACANVTNLLLGQAVQRRHEFAVRMALGSGRGRLARQVLIEAGLLGLAGAAMALALTGLGGGVVRAMASQVPRAAAVGIDWAVLGFGAIVGLGAGLVFGLLPARASLEAASEGLRLGGRATGRHGLRRALVVAEVAIAAALVIGATLLVRSTNRLLAVDPGFRPEGVVVASVQTAGQSFRTDTTVWTYYGQVRSAIAALPGVASVGMVSQLPLSGDFDYYGVRAESRVRVNPDDAVSAARYAVSPGYLETMGIGIVEGRSFSAADRLGAPRVAVVNRHYAKAQFPGGSVLGERIRIGGGDDEAPWWWTVVGVVDNVKQQSLEEPDGPQVYIPNDQWRWGDDLWVVVRAEGDPAALERAIRRAVRSVHPDPTVQRVMPMTAIIGEGLVARRLVLRLFGAFGVLSLVLAAVGVYGVMASQVAERTRELGIRAAIGASAGALRRSVLGESAALGGLGLAIGGGLAGAVAGPLARGLYGFTVADPMALGLAAMVLLLAVVVAAWVPAERAARLDPGAVIRQE